MRQQLLVRVCDDVEAEEGNETYKWRRVLGCTCMSLVWSGKWSPVKC